MIEATQLTRRYGDFIAVDSVSFSIPQGQIVGLLGHNGAGKTTIMKMITGCLEPSGGIASIAGLDVTQNLMHIQSKIGYLPETCPVYPDMPVALYLEYMAELRQIEPNARAKAIAEALKQTELSDRSGSIISTLSKGLKQRVGIAQAILHKPEILILDEPTSGLDPTQIDEIRTLIKSLSSSTTIILSTHILQEVEAICDRVLILSGGKLAMDSKLSELTQSNSLMINIGSAESSVESKLSALKGVNCVALQSGNGTGKTFKLSLSDNVENVSPEVAKTIVDCGISLYSLQPEKKSLETIFREVSSR
ncbi:MAG: ATP-binding cassette domain-containing protein [Bdellovibrionota bacterium]